MLYIMIHPVVVLALSGASGVLDCNLRAIAQECALSAISEILLASPLVVLLGMCARSGEDESECASAISQPLPSSRPHHGIGGQSCYYRSG